MKIISAGTCFATRIPDSYRSHRQEGFTNFLFDFDAYKTQDILEGDESMRYVSQNFINRCKADGITVDVAKTPVFSKEIKSYPRARLEAIFNESFQIAVENNCKEIIVMPYMDDDKNPWSEEETISFYESLIPVAREKNLKIIVKNQPAKYNGNVYRGAFSDRYRFKEIILRLNQQAGQDIFEIMLDADVANDLGQRNTDLVEEWGNLISIISCCAHSDQTDFVRALRKIGYDGALMIDRDFSSPQTQLFITKDYTKYTKAFIDSVIWQINMEKTIRKYDNIVLFGAGIMCRIYMKEFGEINRPVFVCDNNSCIWDGEICGIDIKSPEALKQLPGDTAIFICNTFYDEITEQLKSMNLPNPIERFNDQLL